MEALDAFAVQVIRKTYTKLSQAESYQNRLYNRFESVRLVQWPMFGEAGQYVWHVSDKPAS